MMTVREEVPADIAAIRAVNRAAFGGPDEAKLVERLRADGELILSLVADDGGDVVGHCGFSRLRIDAAGGVADAVSLAPVAVLPAQQKRGVGKAMIADGIARLTAAGETLIVVLGAPAYYARFGFDAGAASRFRTPYDGPYLQVLPLSGRAPSGGAVRYPAAFAAL